MNKNMVTVIITTYKRPFFLERALNSVLKQTYKNIKIIIIDDNDEISEYRKETERKLKKYMDKITYIKNKKNIGACNSRNKALEYTNSKYISFLDDDDEYLENFIEKAYEKITKKDLGLVYSQAYIKDEDNNLLIETNSKLSEEENALENHLIKGINSTSTILFKKEVIIKAGKWIQIPCGQEDFLITRIFSLGEKGESISDKLVNIYFHKEERISIGKNKINGLKQLFELKKQFITKLPKASQKIAESNYYIAISIANREYKKLESIKNYLKALSICFFRYKNITTLFILIVGVNKYLILKNKLNLNRVKVGEN